MKISASKHAAILEALPEIIETLNDCAVDTETKIHISLLTEVWQKMTKQQIVQKAQYKLSLTVPQKLAMVLAVELGLFQSTQYIEMTMGMLMLEIHKEVA